MARLILHLTASLISVAAAQPTSYRTCGADEKASDCMMEFMSLKMSQLAILQENIRHDQTRQHQDEMGLVQGIREDISQASSQLQTTNDELAQATSRLESVRNDVSQATSRLESVRNDVSQATSQLETVRNDVSQATSRLESVRNDVSQATSQLETVRNDVSQATSRLETVRNDVSQATSQLGRIQNDILNATTQLRSTRDHLSQATSQLETVRDDVSRQTTLLENIRREQSEHQSQSVDLLESIDNKQSQQQTEVVALLNNIQRLVSRPKNCKEVQSYGHEVSGSYTVYPFGDDSPVMVYCDMVTDGGGWTVFQRRQDGSVNFRRSWADYRDGFGNPDGEHWLGNKYIHALTAASAQEMRVELGSWEDERVYARYGQFGVGSEADGYRLTVGAYSGTAGGDSLGAGHNGMKFSTFDRDNDKWDDNSCANKYKSGFWFNNCFRASLNYPYRHSSSVSDDWFGIIWYDFKGEEYSLKFTELKMRPL